MDIQNFYNHRWENYSLISRTKLVRCIRILETIAGIPIDKPYILDLGCGTGWLSNILSLIGPTVGIDISDNAILQAKKTYPNVTFIQTDLMKPNSIPESLIGKFDIVVSQEVIEHLDNQQKTVSLTATLIKHGGYLVITTPNRRAYNLLPNGGIPKNELQPIENWLTVSELKQMLTHDFHIIKSGTFIHGGIKNKVITNWFFRLRTFFRLLHSEFIFNEVTSLLGLGLHIYILAQRKENNLTKTSVLPNSYSVKK